MLEDKNTLVDWGVISRHLSDSRVHGKLKDLILQYKPGMFVLEDVWAKSARRSRAVKNLCRKISDSVNTIGVRVTRIAYAKALIGIGAPDGSTKHEVATIVADRFPEELGKRAPRKRQPWMSEDRRMSFFTAIALSMAAFEGSTWVQNIRGKLRSSGGTD